MEKRDPRTGCTAKQEAYAQARARGETQTAAYNKAYGRHGGTDKTRTEAASRLENDSNVAARIAQLGRQVEQVQLWDRAKLAAWLLQMSTDDGISPGVRSSYAKLYAEVTGARSPVQVELAGGVGLSLQDRETAAAEWVERFTRSERPQEAPQSPENAPEV